MSIISASTEKLVQSIEGMDDYELAEWLECLDEVALRGGGEQVTKLLNALRNRALGHGIKASYAPTTPYINTIPPEHQPAYPGDREIERRLKSFIRWNAMAMVVRANRNNSSLGGHISTYASSATLLEVGFNHFFHAKTEDHAGDFVYFQGHASPGVYARAFLEGRIDEATLEKFRREIPRGSGLSSYPHPWLMPNFWQFPTVSMGLGPMMAIYQARFLRYMENRGITKSQPSRVWIFAGDGEMDEPESVAALTLAAREGLDNLTYVVNCNLQRLDGPVRGNGKIIQELEGLFRGAGWNVIKVIWGSKWDELLEADQDGLLVDRLNETVDGQYQKYSISPGEYIREKFFGKSPELKELIAHMTDKDLKKLNRGGHDPLKVYAAYHAAVHHNGQPTVILAKTIKGYGLGEGGEGRNITHKQKEMNEEELLTFRTRFNIPLKDDEVAHAPFFRPDENSPEIKYLHERRKALGGYVPSRNSDSPSLKIPPLESFDSVLKGTGDRTASTTMGFGRMLNGMLKDESIGKRIVPIFPDEARTFGLEALFAQYGIYSPKGQLYDSVDAENLIRYKEAKDGQLLEEGINEAGSISSYVAAGTAYSTLGVPMIPFYLYYSMFGFQRVGDFIWAAADARAKGFLLGCTSGRTTLNGEGLQHQDGHSLLYASTIPTFESYDPAFGYELAVIIHDGLRRMYQDGETLQYYIALYNEAYQMPAIPEGAEQGILSGMYELKSVDAVDQQGAPRVQLFGSGPILNEVLKAQELLAKTYGISSDVWSVTSYNRLRREARDADRWNRLHPAEEAKQSYLETVLKDRKGPFIACSDNISQVQDQIAPWIPGEYYALGTDGFGRSDTRETLREHFEVNANHVVFQVLTALANESLFDQKELLKAIKDLGIDPEKVNPVTA